MANFDQGYALIVGVANYPNVRPLPESVLNDARATAAILQDPSRAGYPADHVKVILDKDATKQNILNGLAWLTNNTGKDSTAVFYFSGHGGRITEGASAGNYLIPFDTRLNSIKQTAISSAELTSSLNKIQTQKLVVLLDACHSGGTGDTKGDLRLDGLINTDTKDINEPDVKTGLDEKTYDQLKEGSGRVIFASSKTDEVSYVMPNARNSLFTECLLEALNGKARNDGDGLLRIFEVVSYVFGGVSARQPKQHPIFKVSNLDANFPLALYLGGEKSLEAQPSAPMTANDLIALLPKMKPRLDTSNEVAVREFLVEHFDSGELEVLCSDVAVAIEKGTGRKTRLSLDIVGATGKSLKLAAQTLVTYLSRRSQLQYLIEVLKANFPDEV